MQKWYMLKKLFFVMFFKSDQKNLSFQETENITRSIWKKRSSWCFRIFDYLQFLNHLWKTSQIIFFFCAQIFEHNMDFYIVLTMFHFICLVQHSNIPSKQKNIIPDNNGEKNVSSDLAISAQKYPKIVTQEDKKFQSIHTLFFKTTLFFKAFWRCFSHVYGHKKDLQPKQKL